MSKSCNYRCCEKLYLFPGLLRPPQRHPGMPQRHLETPRDLPGTPRDTQKQPGTTRDLSGSPRDNQGSPRDIQGSSRDTQGHSNTTRDPPRDSQRCLRVPMIWGVSPGTLGALGTLDCLGTSREPQDILSKPGA